MDTILVSGRRYKNNGGRSWRKSCSFVKMSFVRIRLTFQRPLPLSEVKNCWFLVDTSACNTIADLEYLIKKRFKELSKSCSSVDLFLDDYLLPSQEKIEIIQNNDNIRCVLSIPCFTLNVTYILPSRS